METKNTLEMTIRKAVIEGNSTVIRPLLLNSDQIDLIATVRNYVTMTASRLSYLADVSIQNASSKLRRLHTAGYLERTESSADSGGIEYVFTVAKSL